MSSSSPSGLSAPLKIAAFRNLWVANIVSNVGTLMQSVGAAWLMTSLTSSTTLVGLVQTASTLPVFLVGFLAGVLADTVERKRLLFWSQLWIVIVALVLAVITWLGLITPWVLLGLTFALGFGAAISLPAWQATVQDMVPRESVPAAVSLNSIAFNVARAVGPAIGGVLVAATGAASAFFLNAVSFIAVIGAVATWKPGARQISRLSEDMFGALRAGFRYLIHSRRLQSPIIRASAFNFFASVVWPLGPLYARDVLHTTASGYGLLLAFFGMGSIVSALLVPRLRSVIQLERILTVGSVISAGSLVGLAFAHEFWVAAVAIFFAGTAWVGVLVNFNVAPQTAVPAWVRGRALSFYLLAFQGVLALGGLLWGGLAGHIGIAPCFNVAAGGLVVGLILSRYFPISLNEDVDLRPSMQGPEVHSHIDLDVEDGPVLVLVEFQIAPEKTEAFRETMRCMRELRMRNGAHRWRLYQDIKEPQRFVELFRVDSWGEHLRQHERLTVTDLEVQTAALAFHEGPEKPRVHHYLNIEG